METSAKNVSTIFAVIFTVYFFIFIFRGQPASYTSQEALTTSTNLFLAAALTGIIAVVFALIALNKKDWRKD